MHQNFHDLALDEMTDMHFVFELDGGDVKFAANRAILSRSSPVFDAMFNGDLKERGDVKIVDSSPAAFKEFLQFFHEQHVKLTMDNIGDVLNLVNKYDVADCFAICVNFLKDNVVLNEVLWALYLAFKFQLVELAEFCKCKIQQNIEYVMNMFDLNGDEVNLMSNPSNRFVPELHIGELFTTVFAISKAVISNQSKEIINLRKKCVFPITLSQGYSYEKLKPKESITFSLDGDMLLTLIICSPVHNDDQYYTPPTFDMIIKERPPNADSKTLFNQEVTLNQDDTVTVKLRKAIRILSGYNYSIILKFPYAECYSSWTSTIRRDPTKLTKDIDIFFPPARNAAEYSLVHCLHFEEIFDWFKLKYQLRLTLQL